MIQLTVSLGVTFLIGYFVVTGIATFVKKVAEGIKGIFKKGGNN